MTKDEALRLALEALKQIDEAMPFPVAKLAQKVIKEALAQPEHGWTPERIAGMARLKEAQDKKLAQLEPVAWEQFYPEMGKPKLAYLLPTESRDNACYTPPQRTWVGLTDEEVKNFVQAVWPREATPTDYIRAIEAKLKAKNT